jgi:small subunit ribosomal protein S15
MFDLHCLIKKNNYFCKLVSQYLIEARYIIIINHLSNVGMYLTSETKKEIFKKFGNSETNTGSTEGQIALFTHRINHLTGHLKINKKDFNTERALIKLVGKRRSLLDYLIKIDIVKYRELIKELGIRK